MSISILKETNEHPAYIVDLNSVNPKKEAGLARVQICAQRFLNLNSKFLVHVKNSIYPALRNGSRSFFDYVLARNSEDDERYVYSEDDERYVFTGNTERAARAYVNQIACRSLLWSFYMSLEVVNSAFSCLIDSAFSEYQILPLKDLANGEINVEHMKTHEIALDASSVPVDIQVDNLKDIFFKINFTDEKSPGYIPSSSCKEGKSVLTRNQLEEQLDKFIYRVKAREAFIGTPPEIDSYRRMKFYQQIEDAVRLSIYKAVTDVEEFEKHNDTSCPRLSTEKKREYTDLLHRRARVALDLAIAGGHCGARYMGEAMDVYYTLYGYSIQKDKNLRETLLEILAEKRKEIAKAEIQKHLGANAHPFTKYMGNMGRLLGIPGTKNITEHLSEELNISDLLNKFFQVYTEEAIIDAIQEKVKTSQLLREKVVDWIKDQAGSWNSEQWEEKAHLIVQKLEEIQKSSFERVLLASDFEIFQELLVDLRKKRISFPEMKDGWDNFLTEFLSSDETKKLCSQSDRNKMQLGCSLSVLGSELVQNLKKRITSGHFTPIPREEYRSIFVEKAKVAEMNQVLLKYGVHMEEDTLFRIVRNKIDLVESVKNCIDRNRREDFLSCFSQDQDLDLITEKGLSKELLEWILVSQGILHPQVVNALEPANVNIGRNLARRYINVVHQGFYNNPNTPTEVMSKLPIHVLYKLLAEDSKNLVRGLLELIPAINKKRYVYNVQSEKEKVLTWIFNQSFQHNANEIIKVAEIIKGKKELYSYWERLYWTQLPLAFSNLFARSFFKSTMNLSTAAVSGVLVFKIYSKIQDSFLNLVSPNAPFFKDPLVIKAAAGMFAAIYSAVFMEEKVFDACDKISLRFYDMSQKVEQKQIITRKNKCLEIWKKCQRDAFS